METSTTTKPVGRIKQLSASIVNKIAAGEVIERPASVVKELLENSVDAGADRIELTIENGGADLIRVVDNGHGIAESDLNLAVTSHATSKIQDVDDLFAVSTMGFRGEALASITEISQATIRSRTAEQDSGYELIVNGGQAEAIVPCGCPTGTTIEIANLFFNTPVRRKFLKTTQTEMGHIVEAFTRVAIPNPHVQMTLKNRDRVTQDLPASQNWLDRIHHFFGEEISSALIPVSSERDGIVVSGYVADPKVSRANNRMQYLFLNGRHIRDRSLQHALSESYRGLLMTGRFPVVFLQLSMPPDLVDVNVHPAKLEVRFQDGGRIYSQLLSAIRNRFLSTDLTARTTNPISGGDTPTAQLGSPFSGNPTGVANHVQGSPMTPSHGTSGQPSYGVSTPNSSGHQSDMERWSRGSIQDAFGSAAQQSSQAEISFGSSARRDFISQPLTRANELPPGSLDEPLDGSTSGQDSEPNVESNSENSANPTRTHSALQLHNRYLITQNEEGMVVVDQHALHERIIYEQLREKVVGGKLETQRLLVPEPVSLTAAEAALVLDSKDVLQQIGIEVEPFGGDSVLVSGYPAMLANHDPAEMLRGLLEILMSEGKSPERRDVIDSLLHMISCKAAIKAGDKLTPDEIEDLLKHGELCQDAHHCPHGRPTALVFSRHELDKRFKRI